MIWVNTELRRQKALASMCIYFQYLGQACITLQLGFTKSFTLVSKSRSITLVCKSQLNLQCIPSSSHTTLSCSRECSIQLALCIQPIPFNTYTCGKFNSITINKLYPCPFTDVVCTKSRWNKFQAEPLLHTSYNEGQSGSTCNITSFLFHVTLCVYCSVEVTLCSRLCTHNYNVLTHIHVYHI